MAFIAFVAFIALILKFTLLNFRMATLKFYIENLRVTQQTLKTL